MIKKIFDHYWYNNSNNTNHKLGYFLIMHIWDSLFGISLGLYFLLQLPYTDIATKGFINNCYYILSIILPLSILHYYVDPSFMIILENSIYFSNSFSLIVLITYSIKLYTVLVLYKRHKKELITTI